MSTEVRMQRLEKRINNLEEVVKKLLTLYSNLASNKQVQELVAVVNEEIKDINTEVTSINNRLEILEEIPEIDF